MLCKIVEDLLPNYVVGVTSKESNKLVEEHIKVCDECRTEFEYMSNDIEIKKNKVGERDYLKRVNRRLRNIFILCTIIIIISFIGSIVAVETEEDRVFGILLYIFIGFTILVKFIMPLLGVSVGIVSIIKSKKLWIRVISAILLAVSAYYLLNFLIHIINSYLIYGF